MDMIILFILGFILGLIYCFLSEILPIRIPGIEKKEPNSWIFNLFIGTLNGLVFILSNYAYNISYEFFAAIIIAGLFFMIYMTDFKYMIILDSPLIISGILILILKYHYFGIKSVGLSLLSGAILFFLMFLIGYIGSKIFKKDALGGGDVKLCGIIGIILALRLGLISIIISSLLALPYALACIMLNKNKEVPYGPFLVSSLVLIFLFMDKFTNMMQALF